MPCVSVRVLCSLTYRGAETYGRAVMPVCAILSAYFSSYPREMSNHGQQSDPDASARASAFCLDPN